MSAYDCLVVGAGPAGAAAAAELARRGRRVIILERGRLPRRKCCAGGVPLKVASLPGLDLAGVPASPIRGAVHSWKGKPGLEVSESETLGWVVDRARFDQVLVEAAQAAGAELVEGTDARLGRNSASGVAITAAGRCWEGKTLIAADGASGAVSRRLGFRSPQRGFGLEVSLRPPPAVQESFGGRLFFDFGLIPRGYAWIFPGPGFLNLGAAVRRPRDRGLLLLLEEYARLQGLGEWFDPSAVRGAPLAFPSRRLVPVRGCCLAAGDAAGLVDRLTGEGIYPALRSGLLAARSVDAFLQGGSLAGYRPALRDELLADLVWSVRLSRLQDWFPGPTYRRAVLNPRRAHKMLLIGLGKLRYRDLFRRRS